MNFEKIVDRSDSQSDILLIAVGDWIFFTKKWFWW